MYKKCANCYKDGKVPNEESCKKCEDALKAKEQECETLASQLDFEVQKKECLEQECERLKEENAEIRKYQYAQDFLQQQLDQAIAQREAFWAMYKTKHGDLADKYEKLKAEKEVIEKLTKTHLAETFEMQEKIGQFKAENEELKELIAQDQCFQDKSHKCVKSFYIDE